MAIRIRLGDYRRMADAGLGRQSVGYFPRMTEAEVLEAGRGVWRLDMKVAGRERFLLITDKGEGLVRAVAEINGITEHDGERGLLRALEAELLSAGHPLYDRYIGQPDPLANSSRNSVAYGDLPEELPFRTHDCACGCGESTTHDFVPGHELRAIQARVREHFGGSALAFITWLDTELPPKPDAPVPA